MHVFDIQRGIIGDQHLLPDRLTVSDPDLQIVFMPVGAGQRDQSPVADAAVVIAVPEVQGRFIQQRFCFQNRFLTGIHIHQDQFVLDIGIGAGIHAGQEGHAFHCDRGGFLIIRCLFHTLHELGIVSRRLERAALAGCPVLITGIADTCVCLTVIGCTGTAADRTDPQSQKAALILKLIGSAALIGFLLGILAQHQPVRIIIGRIQRIMCIQPEDVYAFLQSGQIQITLPGNSVIVGDRQGRFE